MVNFELFFDNGGGVTLQTENYRHYYQDGAQAADDVKFLLDGGDINEWDGNEKEESEELEYGPGYSYLIKNRLIDLLNGENEEAKEEIISGYTGSKFLEFFGIKDEE